MKTLNHTRLWLINLLNQFYQDEMESKTIALRLMQFVTNLNTKDIYMDSRALVEDEHRLIIKHADYLLKGFPLEYITNSASFYNLELSLDRGCLIPRADTELLVDLVLEKAKQSQSTKEQIDAISPHRHAPLSIIDLGLGSGAIALAIKANLKLQADIYGFENSAEALQIALHNANKLQLSVDFIEVNWHDDWKNLFSKFQTEQLKQTEKTTNTLSSQELKFDFIVANPPYIAADDPHLEQLIFEPVEALVAKNHGLEHYPIIAKKAKMYLKHNGWVMVEHGYNQALEVQKIFNGVGLVNVQTFKDLNQQDRVTLAMNNNHPL